MEYLQNYDPLHHPVLSTGVAALPVVTLLYLLALHPRRAGDGSVHLGIAAHRAAMIAVAVAVGVALVVFRMPVRTAGMSLVFGAMYGIFPIGWIVIGAMFLYTITLVSGLFDVLKDSVASLSADRRVQAILIAFSFGAFVEGAAGFGTPVAISGAILVGLGFAPLEAAVLCLIANTAPVAFGALGTPITALSGVTDISPMLISRMAARQLPFFSMIVPVWMVAVQVRMEGRGWRDVAGVWPALVVSGGTFAGTQFLVGNYWNHLLVDILGGVVSMGAVAVLCRFWQPSDRKDVLTEMSTPVDGGVRVGTLDDQSPHKRSRVVMAWVPWALLTIAVFAWGIPGVKKALDGVPGAKVDWGVPAVNGVVYRTPPVVTAKAIDKAIYSINWLSAPGTGIVIAAIISGVVLGLSPGQWGVATVRTAARLRLPLLTICLILSMGFITKYSGMDAVLGLAFTRTGRLYPFFAAMLGWLGVALTGSDTSSNVMFGSMQKITAQQAGLNSILIVTANSTGGVMGKMIDAQSIVVATAACYEDQREGKLAVGPIFRAVLPHSVALAVLMGILVMLQAYVFKGMIPK